MGRAQVKLWSRLSAHLYLSLARNQPLTEAPKKMPRTLCRLADLPEGAARGFPPPPGGFTGLVALRREELLKVYVNACPHLGLSLDIAPDRFLSADGNRIVCANHGAEFRLQDGVCTSGPCLGERLQEVMIEIKDGCILVPEDAGL